MREIFVYSSMGGGDTLVGGVIVQIHADFEIIMSPIDLEEAERSLGGAEVLRSTAEMFLATTDEMFDELRVAVSNGHASIIREKAHWIKGSFVYLHAAPSAQGARNLEQATNLGPAEVQCAFMQLEGEVERLKVVLRGFLAKA